MKKALSLFLCAALLLGLLPLGAVPVQAAGEEKPLSGVTFSILGDSISTYENVSNNTSYNSTLGYHILYYLTGRHGVYQADTWWQQMADVLGMQLLVNNSWSGSCLLNPRKGEESVGYGDRCENLHNDHTGQEPDVIFVSMGTNDFTYYPETLGTAAQIDYAALITENEDGTFAYGMPTTSCEAYAVMLHRITTRYPQAQVYCMNLLARRDPDLYDAALSVEQPGQFNQELAQIAARFGAEIIDLENCGITAEAEVFDLYMADSRMHPNVLGMDLITRAVVSSLMQEETEVRDIRFDLLNVDQAEGTAHMVLHGGAFTAQLTEAEGFQDMTLRVTMGGEDITDSCCADGVISIPEVTADVCISGWSLRREAKAFRWQSDGTQLVTLTAAGAEANALTGQADGSYTMDTDVLLLHDRPWTIRWKMAGDFAGTLLSSDTAMGSVFLSRIHGAANMLAFGTCEEGENAYYGVSLEEENLSGLHTYCLENRVDADGGNMVYLSVDDRELGPMNLYTADGQVVPEQTADWLVGRDLVLRDLGSGFLPVYLRIWEQGGPSGIEDKVISVLGDGISTFAGYIPVADGFNQEHTARYPQDGLLTDVNETWWMQVLHATGAKLGINDSWCGTGVYSSSCGAAESCMASQTRIQNLGSNGTPDVILFYGGSDDLSQGYPLGSFDPATAPTEADLTAEEWESVADAYVTAILRMQHHYPNAKIIALLPACAAGQYSDETLAQCNAIFAAICAHYGVTWVDLSQSGIAPANLPDGIHPDAAGMDDITSAVLEALAGEVDLVVGEHLVWPVSHQLSNVTASLGHWQGISHGFAFEEELEGTGLAVTVTMGGVDITQACYADGVISIPEVTGALVITATGSCLPEEQLQQLPEETYCDTNLWEVLTPRCGYFNGMEWVSQYASITFPVTAGDTLWASSFRESGSNGGSQNGIRVTWFLADGTVLSLEPDSVYAQFSADGFLTAPEGAVAVNVPMWDPAGENEVYLLSLPERPELLHTLSGTITVPEETQMPTEILLLQEQTTVFSAVVDGNPINYVIPDLKDGSYLLQISREGFETYTAEILLDGADVVHDVKLVKNVPEITYASISTSMAGDVALNFYVVLSEDMRADEGAYMVFTVAGKTQVVPLSETTTDVESDGSISNKFSCKLAAKQMSDTVVAQMYTSDGTPVGEAKSYTIRRYCDAVISAYSADSRYTDLVELMRAMLNYGAASQLLFNYNTGDLANSALTDTTLPVLTEAMMNPYAPVITDNDDGISLSSLSLLFESTTKVRFYFTLDGSKSIDAYTFLVDGVEVEPRQDSSGEWYVDKTDIAAKNLDKMATVQVGNLTATGCGLSYVRQVAIRYPHLFNQITIDAVRALYGYAMAANAYFE